MGQKPWTKNQMNRFKLIKSGGQTTFKWPKLTKKNKNTNVPKNKYAETMFQNCTSENQEETKEYKPSDQA